MTTLFQAKLDLAECLTNVLRSVATGGGNDNLIDTELADKILNEADDYWNGGTIFLLDDTECAVVKDYDNATKKFTFSANASVTVAAADNYSAINADFPHYELVRAINAAIKGLGNVPQIYTNATYITVANQEAYDLPTNVYNVKRVGIATATSTPYKYVRNYYWRELNNDIMFDTNKAPKIAGYLIRLTYVTPHAEVTTDSGVISNYIHRDLLRWAAAEQALRWKYQRMRDSDPDILRLWNEAKVNANIAEQKHPIPTIKRDPHLAI